MTDVLLFQSPDGGEVEVLNGVLTLDDSPFTAVYLSLFGGNVDDDGTSAKAKGQWWGNLAEPDATRHYRSRTQAALIGLPAITANAKRLEEAAKADIDWLLATNVAASVTVAVSMPARNTARFDIKIVGRDGTESNFVFTKPWGKS